MNDGRRVHFGRCESTVRNVNDAPNTETAKIVTNIPINSEVYQEIKAVRKQENKKEKRQRTISNSSAKSSSVVKQKEKQI